MRRVREEGKEWGREGRIKREGNRGEQKQGECDLQKQKQGDVHTYMYMYVLLHSTSQPSVHTTAQEYTHTE